MVPEANGIYIHFGCWIRKCLNLSERGSKTRTENPTEEEHSNVQM